MAEDETDRQIVRERAPVVYMHPYDLGWYANFLDRPDIVENWTRDYPGQQGLGLAKLRLDGFVSLDAQDGEGVLVTRPMVFEGRSLSLNANASTGIVKVGLLDASGQPVSPFTEDKCDVNSFNSVDQKVTWDSNGDLSEWSGRPVRLRFHMRHARLYAFTFKQ